MKTSKNNPINIYLSKCKRIFLIVFLFGFTINMLVMFVPLYTMQVFDKVIASSSIETLIMLTILTVTSIAFMSIIDGCRHFIMSKVADWLDSSLAPEIIEKTIGITVIKHISSSEMLRELQNIKSFLGGNAVFSLFDIPWSIIYIFVAFTIHYSVGFISIFGIVLLLVLAAWNELATGKVIKDSSDSYIRNAYYIETATRNSEVLEAMGMSKNVMLAWNKNHLKTRNVQAIAASKSIVISSITKFSRTVLQISIIGVGSLLAISGIKSPGSIIASSILVGRALSPFEASISTWKQLVTARLSYRKLTNLLQSTVRMSSMQLPKPEGKVFFDKVVFTPMGAKSPTVKGVSVAIEPGETIGVIGPSAAGKSTLAKLLVGVWKPISGSVRLDSADVYNWDREDFGKHVGYLPQNIELFNASVKENIARMNKEVDPDLVVKAAKIAGIHEVILSLPNGYETIIGSGTELSGGQKQRIGLARAFYGDMKLIVLDEPNSNLDQSGEASLVQAIKYAKDSKITLFITTHRLSLLSEVDKVLVLQNGAVAAYGPRNDIMKKIMPPRPEQKKETKEKSDS